MSFHTFFLLRMKTLAAILALASVLVIPLEASPVAIYGQCTSALLPVVHFLMGLTHQFQVEYVAALPPSDPRRT